ncbi:nicotinate (nicotinamide) nucleotide adenylyltransferase [Pseudodesulfovibrio piezophilus]|uniref:Probable nicotinate-nucleotide adenylyltransferase n=1 Tax=Pseudodesulfovibrio piezophilus (strain DSM 21447 / JCM 15486 / C1TLV30) TaxID=1322246 RepID=M1WUA0_PSEP2|nr:nicotinate (nicotinamide) nucleotide adenylyltransferase [Pseudodesulfovibrio piezophilus]CCH50422.1 putative nicotinate-nucleotide adenylyltransferase [Pseudodesulfovibrio piezophilus C1TLV30]
MKIGILGGSFNPIHIGHIRMGIEVLERLGLDRVELVPAKRPPHKDGSDILPFDLRLELVERAIVGIPGLGSNALEGERAGPSFTCDTLHCYQSRQPKSKISFILGASTFLELPSWRRGVEIPEMASLVVVNRWTASDKVAGFIADHWPGAEPQGEGKWVFSTGQTIDLLDIPRMDIKAGHIRRRWLEKRNLRFLVPQAVEAVLEEKAALVEESWGKRR